MPYFISTDKSHLIWRKKKSRELLNKHQYYNSSPDCETDISTHGQKATDKTKAAGEALLSSLRVSVHSRLAVRV